MKTLFLTLTLLSAVCSLTFGALTGDDWKAYKTNAFSITLPPKVKCEVSPAIDFTIYDFKREGSAWLSTYVGSAPDFPSKQAVEPISSSETINGLSVKVETRYYQNHTKTSREYLFSLSDKPSLHVWYNVLSGLELTQAEKSIHSIVLK